MTNIVKILSDIQERLVSALPELEYVDKDRGQLSDGNTEIKFPCALLDVKNIDFSLEGKGIRMADIQLVVNFISVIRFCRRIVPPESCSVCSRRL